MDPRSGHHRRRDGRDHGSRITPRGPTRHRVTDEQKDVIEQLERRVATLENMVRRLTFVANTAEQLRGSRAPTTKPQIIPVVHAALPDKSPEGPNDLEQWFGQRGLLAVGVAALLIAAALFLKYAFDRG